MGEKQVYKLLPLHINGVALYRVREHFPGIPPEWDRSFVVAAHSPDHAAELIKGICESTDGTAGQGATYTAQVLGVYQPESWWRPE